MLNYQVNRFYKRLALPTSNTKIIKISVEDSGIGIKPENLEHLGKPFATFDNDGLNKQGIGLGLNICRKIVGQLGPKEELLISSKYGKGAKFEFYLYTSKDRTESLNFIDIEILSEENQIDSLVNLKNASSSFILTHEDLVTNINNKEKDLANKNNISVHVTEVLEKTCPMLQKDEYADFFAKSEEESINSSSDSKKNESLSSMKEESLSSLKEEIQLDDKKHIKKFKKHEGEKQKYFAPKLYNKEESEIFLKMKSDIKNNTFRSIYSQSDKFVEIDSSSSDFDNNVKKKEKNVVNLKKKENNDKNINNIKNKSKSLKKDDDNDSIKKKNNKIKKETFPTRRSITLNFSDDPERKLEKKIKKKLKKFKTGIANKENSITEDGSSIRKKGNNIYNVLIVDDNVFNLMILESYIKKITDVTIHIGKLFIYLLFFSEKAINGLIAVDIFKGCNLLKSKKNIDIIVMDCDMPILNGYDAAKEIKKKVKSHKFCNVKIIAYTSFCGEDEQKKCEDFGMDYYLLKPASEEEFHKILKKVIEDIKENL